jgi:hypothetical protein
MLEGAGIGAQAVARLIKPSSQKRSVAAIPITLHNTYVVPVHTFPVELATPRALLSPLSGA